MKNRFTELPQNIKSKHTIPGSTRHKDKQTLIMVLNKQEPGKYTRQKKKR
ncbi:hypothetical protein [Pedobacter miscanthi]|nr:hypothetical protein [Pedobacter miscanthi]